MLRLVLRQIRHAGVRTAGLAAAITVAAFSFVMLASAAKTSELRVRGSVEGAFRPAYDILVRPRGSFTQLERRDGLVRDNYLSGLFGGISLGQYEAIKGISRVEVAAPIANLGYVLPFAFVDVPLDDLLDDDPVQLLRVRFSMRAHAGRSRYTGKDVYVYYTRRNPLSSRAEILPDGRALEVCAGFSRSKPYQSAPFALDSYLTCFSALSPGQGTDGDPRYRFGRVTLVEPLHFPLLVAAIDPVQEARLLNIDRAVVSGRYLRDGEGTGILRNAGGYGNLVAPTLASTRTYVDERLVAQVERLRPPAATRIPQTLASSSAYRFLTGLPGTPVGQRSFSANEVYERVLEAGPRRKSSESVSYWIPADVTYRRLPDGTLEPRTVSNPISIWESPVYGQRGYYPAPPANKDVQFRRLQVYVGTHLLDGKISRRAGLQVVGRYDPLKLPGFNPLSRVPLETYYPPLVEPADERSRRALGGKPLQPSENLGDYVQQPPLMLTTLEAMKPLLDPESYEGPDRRAAPLSAIRIRVSGVRGPDDLSMARIRGVALEIRERTGLDVDITAGSSPRQLEVRLPAGRFGRPELLLEEGWVKKGVSVAFLRAVDEKSVALAGLILVACGLFVGNGAFASVRARRREIGTLLCLGWTRQAIFVVVLGEVVLLGILAGVAGTLIALALVAAFDLDIALARTLLVLPVATALALAAGLIPAWLAARSVPLDAVRPAITGRIHGRRVRTLTALALANVGRVRTRTLVGIAGLLGGVGTLTLMLGINRAFQGTLTGTLLGDAILIRVRDTDFLSIALTILLASLAVADVLFLSLRERAAELVTLKTLGWDDRHLRTTIGLEAVVLGLLGAVGGAIVGLAVGVFVLDVPIAPLAVAAGASAAGGLLLVLIASLAPVSQITRRAAPTLLAEE